MKENIKGCGKTIINLLGNCREHTSKAIRYGTSSQGISQFYLHNPRSFANGMNHTCICLPSRSWYSFTDPGRMEGWVGLRGWLHTEITFQHREFNPEMVLFYLYLRGGQHAVQRWGRNQVRPNAQPRDNRKSLQLSVRCFTAIFIMFVVFFRVLCSLAL